MTILSVYSPAGTPPPPAAPPTPVGDARWLPSPPPPYSGSWLPTTPPTPAALASDSRTWPASDAPWTPPSPPSPSDSGKWPPAPPALPPPMPPRPSGCPTLSRPHPPPAAPPLSPPLAKSLSPPPPSPSPSPPLAAPYPLPPAVRTDPHIYLSPPPPPHPTAPPPSPPPSLPPVASPPPPVIKNDPIVYPSPPPPPRIVKIEPHIYPSPPPPPVARSPPPMPAPSMAPSPSPSPAQEAPAADQYSNSSPSPAHSSPPRWQSFHRPLEKPRPSAAASMGRAHSTDNGSRNIVISKEAATVIVALTGLAMLSFLGAAVWFVRQQRRRPDIPIIHNANIMPSAPGSSLASDIPIPRSLAYPMASYSASSYGFSASPSEHSLGLSKFMFTLEELSRLTNGFGRENLLGEGGFGCVYRGVLPNGRIVAVKKLKVDNGHGEREFKAEVDTISRVHHRHLVSLVGYCISDRQRMLIYDFVPNNTLYYHLHGNGVPALDWRTRVKIAAGAARGIAYLHEDCHPRIIHRDIKSSNILLDNNFEALVSDFGLARLAGDTNTHVTTQVMGTFGYLAPEYASSGKLTAKSDVYSFGVVLLELITGRKPVDASQPLGDESLVEWARSHLLKALENRDFSELSDPRLEGRYDEDEMYHLIEAAAACIRHSAAMRPRMGQVMRVLDSLSEPNLNNGLQPGHSQIFLEPQSEEIQQFQLREFGSSRDDLSSNLR